MSAGWPLIAEMRHGEAKSRAQAERSPFRVVGTHVPHPSPGTKGKLAVAERLGPGSLDPRCHVLCPY